MQNDKKFWLLTIYTKVMGADDSVVRMIYLSQECPKMNESFVLKFPPYSGIILEAKEIPLSDFERGVVTRFCDPITLHEDERWYSDRPWFGNLQRFLSQT